MRKPNKWEYYACIFFEDEGRQRSAQGDRPVAEFIEPD